MDGDQNAQEDRPGSNQVKRLHNTNCGFCGCELTVENSTKEHVIGRRFVPKGALDREWNLILNACRPCNNKKGDLEDDISAITLNAPLGHYDDRRDMARESGDRKSKKSKSRRTQNPVSQSDERHFISGQFGAAKITFGFTSPPQIDSDRLNELALMHITAFCYAMTYDEQTQKGMFWQDHLEVINASSKADWGNPVQVEFAELVLTWPHHFAGSLARGFFKVIIRKEPGNGIWAWALEWNESKRIIGIFGKYQKCEFFYDQLPQLVFKQHNAQYSSRQEKSLPPAEDKLFVLATNA